MRPNTPRRGRPTTPQGDANPDLDRVWKALADRTRREILDELRHGPRTTAQIVSRVPGMTRYGVMKHISVLREAGLVQAREEGRTVFNSLNVIPIRLIYERWVSDYQDLWARQWSRLRRSVEKGRKDRD